VPPNFKKKNPSLNLCSVISGAINWQLHELEVACDSALVTLSRVNWSVMNQVTGHSPYVDDLTNAIDQVVELVKPLVEQKKYLRNFLDKACRLVLRLLSKKPLDHLITISLILTRFTNSVVKSRPLREIGAEQARGVNRYLSALFDTTYSC